MLVNQYACKNRVNKLQCWKRRHTCQCIKCLDIPSVASFILWFFPSLPPFAFPLPSPQHNRMHILRYYIRTHSHRYTKQILCIHATRQYLVTFFLTVVIAEERRKLYIPSGFITAALALSVSMPPLKTRISLPPPFLLPHVNGTKQLKETLHQHTPPPFLSFSSSSLLDEGNSF